VAEEMETAKRGVLDPRRFLVPGMEVFCKDQNRVTGGVIQNGWLIGEFSE